MNPKHRAYDGKMHFVTMAKKYGIDEYAINDIVKHSITDITQKVYIQRKMLKKEIEKIK